MYFHRNRKHEPEEGGGLDAPAQGEPGDGSAARLGAPMVRFVSARMVTLSVRRSSW